MAKQNKTSKEKHGDRRHRIKKQDEQRESQVGTSEIPIPHSGAADQPSIQAQANLLSDRRYRPAQRQAVAARIGKVQGNRHLQRVIKGGMSIAARVPGIQRVVEVRPPGRGEASAFERRGELIDRMNALSSALRFSLDGRAIRYEVADEGAELSNFERRMQAYIDRDEVVPMRLITREGYVGGQSVFVDTLQHAYLDLDDLLASDDTSFQMNLIHLLEERFQIRNYERRIGTNMGPEFARAHRAGLDAEAGHLQSELNDPTIRFTYEETRPNGTVVFGFRSREGYHVFHIFRGAGREVRGGLLTVRTRDGRRLTLEEFKAEREAAAAEEAAVGAPVGAGAGP